MCQMGDADNTVPGLKKKKDLGIEGTMKKSFPLNTRQESYYFTESSKKKKQNTKNHHHQKRNLSNRSFC